MSDFPQGAVEEEYKGNPLIVLNPEDKFAFKFGLSKAKLIMEHLEDIEAFIEKHENSER